ncbi:MAG TPA: UDP-N-acetylglucosamine 1-carboxyvinyltransferase [bacterium (Candidatus Stahlbacteria)]|nr:UDP-N-acetylglucosamine 1-carboxyvinyltransferase [Candidatus Stahlbacteria bacterium]
MDRFIIHGGRRLEGVVRISGAKNSVLPIMAASIIADSPSRISNVPDLADVRTMIELLTHLGARIRFNRNTLHIDPSRIDRFDAPYEIVRKMRASIYVLGALLARKKRAVVSLPGGCAIGPRPIDLHLKGMKELGVDIEVKEGYINGRAKRLKGKEIFLEGTKGTSVGATINVMLCASQAKGKTVIYPAACEPEVIDAARFLKKLGIKVSGEGTHRLVIEGRAKVKGGRHRVIPDRIETGTYAVAAAITRGDVEIESCEPEHIGVVIDRLREIGVDVKVGRRRIRVRADKRPQLTEIVVAPYPGFPTDMQAQFMALLSLAKGTSVIVETIFENRFMQAVELMRMGAKINIEGNTAVITGVRRLTGTKVMASDLRASAALVLAALAAKGRSEINRIYHLDRGYERFDEKLKGLGARIRRVG